MTRQFKKRKPQKILKIVKDSEMKDFFLGDNM